MSTWKGDDIGAVLTRRGFRQDRWRPNLWVRGRQFGRRIIAEVNLEAQSVTVTAKRANATIPVEDPELEAKILAVIRA